MQTNSILTGLTKVGSHFAAALKNTLSSGKYPKAISEGISVGSAQAVGDVASIAVIIDAPQALAYEYGSGIHSKRGPQIRYEIKPKTAGGKLTFPSERWSNYQPSPGESLPKTFAFTFVMHPGVEARPYVEPTLQREKATIRQILGQEFMVAIRIGKQKVTVIRVE